MGKLPTMRSDKSEILPYNFKNYFVFIGTERLSDHPNRCMSNSFSRYPATLLYLVISFIVLLPCFCGSERL